MKGARKPADMARPAVADPRLTRPDWTNGEKRDRKLLWLDKNENSDPAFLELAARVLTETDPVALFSYPESTPLYRKLAAHVGVAPDHLLLTAGSDGAIRAVFEVFVTPGDRVVHTLPTFAMYAVYSRMYGAAVWPVEYQSSVSGPVLTVETVLGVIKEARPKLICLPNPDSPTGTVFAPPEVRRIIDAAERAGAVMLVDEAYYPFYHESALAELPRSPHLVIARTFAKAWGLAGLRIGYAVANPEMIALLNKVRPMYEVSTVAVAVMERMLDFAEEMWASVRRLNAGRDMFLSAMEKLGLRTVHARGNFLHVAFGEWADEVHAALRDLVLYRPDFREPCLTGFSRFSSTTTERFRPVVERIAGVINSSRERRNGPRG